LSTGLTAFAAVALWWPRFSIYNTFSILPPSGRESALRALGSTRRRLAVAGLADAGRRRGRLGGRVGRRHGIAALLGSSTASASLPAGGWCCGRPARCSR
jgi:hypothetical protein